MRLIAGHDGGSADVTSVRHRAPAAKDKAPTYSVSYVNSFTSNLRPFACMMLNIQPFQVDGVSRRPSVLHKCANPACSSLFRSLSRGKLFLLATDASAVMASGIAPSIRRGRSVRQIERYWLCDGCSSLCTLTFERGRGMVTVPLPARKTSQPGLHLMQTQPTAKAYRPVLKGAL